nr:alpha/beta hydrolase [uncultured Rhodoferax sp.]
MSIQRAVVRLLSSVGLGQIADYEGSLRQQVAIWYVKAVTNPDISLDDLRKKYTGRPTPVPARMTRSLQKLCEVQSRRIAGNTVYTLTPRKQSTSWHIVYTHGGAFVNPMQKAHWDIIEALIKNTGATVTVPLYPLAPEHQFMETFFYLERVYEDVLTHTPALKVVFCGDSAGGNLALSHAFHIRERKLPLPARIIMFSPWLDVMLANPDAKALEPKDIMLRVSNLQEMGKWWAKTADLRNPLISPINGDLRKLPPIDIYQGTEDILLADARRFRSLVTEAGGAVQMHETPGGFHVFMGATFTPEAQRVFQQIALDLSGMTN